MYSEEFKNKVIEDFKEYPYYGTIARKYKISENCLHLWVRKANIDVIGLKKEIPQLNTSSYDPSKIFNKDLYDTIEIKEENKLHIIKEDKVANNTKEKIEFEINGIKIKIANCYLKEFIRGITNDWFK